MRLVLTLLLAAAYYFTLLARADRHEWMPLPTDTDRVLQWLPLPLLATLSLAGWFIPRDVPRRRLLWPAVLLAAGMLCYSLVPMVQ